MKHLAACIAFLCVLGGYSSAAVPMVAPSAVTAPMLGRGDVADDVCVWLHPLNPSRSLIFGVNKSETRHGGLYVFQIDGSRWPPSDDWRKDGNWFESGKMINNVDAARGFPAGTGRWDILCAANRTDRTLDVLRVHTNAAGDFLRLELVGRIPIGRGFASGTDAPYGLAVYAPVGSNRCFVFTSDKRGRVAEYEIQFNPEGTGAGQVSGRRFDQAGQPWQISERGCEIEGMVADHGRAVIYIGSEDEGIFRYRLRDGLLDPASKVVVDHVGRRLKADVEGLTLYALADGPGYLLASSQGADQFTVYQREFTGDLPNRHLTNFALGASGRIDAVTSTDGIEVVSANLGGMMSQGLFIVHDGGGASPSNYKIVPWERVAAVIAGRR